MSRMVPVVEENKCYRMRLVREMCGRVYVTVRVAKNDWNPITKLMSMDDFADWKKLSMGEWTTCNYEMPW